LAYIKHAAQIQTHETRELIEEMLDKLIPPRLASMKLTIMKDWLGLC